LNVVTKTISFVMGLMVLAASALAQNPPGLKNDAGALALQHCLLAPVAQPSAFAFTIFGAAGLILIMCLNK
jgi:hypothetical protein